MELFITPRIFDKKPTAHSIRAYICFFKVRMGSVFLSLVEGEWGDDVEGVGGEGLGEKRPFPHRSITCF